MTMIKFKEYLGNVILFLFIISLSVAITINFTPLYHFFVFKDNLGSSVGLSNHALMIEYGKLLAFLNYPWIDRLNLVISSSSKGLHHFYDVKKLFLLNYIVLIVTAMPAIRKILKMKQQKKIWQLIVPCKTMMLFFLVLVIIMILNFNTFFVDFHEVLFRNSDWLFDPRKDPIINALPDTFFMACFTFFFCLVEFFLGCGVLLGKQSLK